MSAQAGSGWLTLVIYSGVFIGIFYFLIVLPRKKQDKKHKEMLGTLRKGERVVTIGGVRGEISRVKDDTVMIKVSENTEIEFLKTAVAYKVEDN